MLFGMTNRLPWAGDPSKIWNVMDEFGIQDSRMLGFWAPSCPVKTGNPDVLATVYARKGRALISIASWGDKPVHCRLEIDWDALGLNRDHSLLIAPAIEDFQEARRLGKEEAIPISPGRGWLLILSEEDVDSPWRR
jgi:hypothetical protein